MKPENILKSSLLDIVFENRHKEYGAYELRKHYDRRMLKSVIITSLVVAVFAVSQSFKVPVKRSKVFVDNLPQIKFTEVTIPQDEVQPKPKEKINQIQKKNAAGAAYSTPKIVEDDKANNPLSEVSKLDSSLIGFHETPGEAVTTEVGITKEEIQTGEVNGIAEKTPEVESSGPLVVAEYMPEFPGGKNALIEFLQRNLRQPNDFEEGEKLTVIASFVVNESGFITNVKITQKGRSDLDYEVVRVINKMPRWKPGSQNGRSVAVYYKVPVTFVAAE